VNINDFINSEVKKLIKNDIEEAEENEVFIIGDIDSESNKITSYELKARGNKNMTPALTNEVRPGQVLIHNHPSGDLRPSAADIRIASRLGQNGIGFAIIDNEVKEIYVVVEPKIPEKEKKLSKEKIIDIFSENGELASVLNDYEYRDEQIKVVEKVIEVFNNYGQSFIEAGTGTGKSFAYLIPALFWANYNNEKIVISTNTINLQEQLINKDLITLKKILPFSFKSVLVKGRSNYVCLRKLKRFKNKSKDLLKDDKEKQMELSRILNWVEDTETGSRSEANFVIDREIWSEISSEGDLCLGTNCPFFSECFFMQARKEVYSADLLVVNHHLLLADARLKYDLNDESGVLPPYKNLIIDEAHNINEVATKHLGKSFYFNSLQKFIDRLNENKYSLVPSIRNDISNHKINDKKKLYKVLDNKITPLIKRIDEFSKNYYNIVKGFFNEYSDDYQLRLKNKYMKTDKWEKVYRNGDKLLGYLTNLNYYFNDLYEDLMLNDNLSEDFDETIVELESILGRLSKLIDNLDFNLEAEENNYVFWLEKKRKRENSIINQMNAPLEVSDLLAEYIWDKLDSLILTSATLTVDKSFDFFANGLGLKNADTLRIESPFDYENQAVLAIPGNIPQANSKDFLDKIIEDLQEIIISYGGETLVLFTSYSMLNYCYNYMTDNFQKHNLNILAQGSYSRKYIIESFKENNSQIIFGTVSFWEGIDIKGDDLKYLIMMKLPFPVPSEAVASARKEKIKENGQNPFYDYSLPRAVIRFKQGFGRLIRSKKDKGMITVLDNRLLNKSYGKIFLNSLPETCPIKKVKMRSLIRKEKIGGSYEK